MTIMKRILTFLAIFLSVCLYSCSTKDDPTTTTNNNGSTKINLNVDSLNLDFEGKGGWGAWTVDADSIKGDLYKISLDNLEQHSGKYSIKMEMYSYPYSKFGVLGCYLPGNILGGKNVEVRGWIKTQGVKYGYAGLWITCWDANYKSMGGSYMPEGGMKGDNDWTQVSVKVKVGLSVVDIGFGGVFQGEGVAWFDDFKLYVDGVKLTN